MKNNVFELATVRKIVDRIEQLTPDTQPKWGTMSVDQMLAHCNVTYEGVYEDKHPKPNFIAKFMLKLFVKNAVVSEKPYPKNSRTAPQFIIKGDKDFELEKKRLTDYLHQTQELGAAHFDGKDSHSFGALSKEEWNNLFYKHINHHLEQFGV